MESTVVHRLATDLLLTGTSTAATNAAFVGGYGQHTLYVTYSPDTDATNALEVTIELSPDYDVVSGTGTWFPYTGEYSGATGTITEGAQVTLSFPSDGVADQNEPPYFFVGSAQGVRIKARETNTPGDFGNYSAWLVSTQP